MDSMSTSARVNEKTSMGGKELRGYRIPKRRFKQQAGGAPDPSIGNTYASERRH
jgi:hypothetical protein